MRWSYYRGNETYNSFDEVYLSRQGMIRNRLLVRILLMLLAVPLLVNVNCSEQEDRKPAPTTTEPDQGKWAIFTSVRSVNGLLIKDNDLWCATTGGVVRLNTLDDTYLTYTTHDGLVSNNVNDVAKDDEGNLWFATSAGVSCYNGDSWETFTEEAGLIDNYVNAVFHDRQDNLWF